MNLAHAFAHCAGKHAPKSAIYYGEQEISFAALHAQVLKLAAHLQNNFALKPGDRVALWLKNCPEFVASVFGILQAGAVVVPVNNFLKPAEVGYILNDAGIDLVISGAEMDAHFPELLTQRKSLRILKIEEIAALPPSSSLNSPSSRAEKDLAVIIYT